MVVGAFVSGARVSGGGDFSRVEALEHAIFWLSLIDIVGFFLPSATGRRIPFGEV